MNKSLGLAIFYLIIDVIIVIFGFVQMALLTTDYIANPQISIMIFIILYAIATFYHLVFIFRWAKKIRDTSTKNIDD